jgi:hypothetical protein
MVSKTIILWIPIQVFLGVFREFEAEINLWVATASVLPSACSISECIGVVTNMLRMCPSAYGTPFGSIRSIILPMFETSSNYPRLIKKTARLAKDRKA